jgi:polar amino acid transport system substrate-binding protein
MKKINHILDEVTKIEPKLGSHLDNTAMYCYALSKSLNLDGKIRELSYFGGLLHDIGKVCFPSNIIRESLNGDQSKIKEHVFYGSSMLMFIEELEKLSIYIKHHHENWDGSGYPSGLSKEEIPVVSRIISLASFYENLINFHELSHEEAAEILRRESGKKLDPGMVESFINIVVEEDLMDL